jgi:hypothetical protein
MASDGYIVLRGDMPIIGAMSFCRLIFGTSVVEASAMTKSLSIPEINLQCP